MRNAGWSGALGRSGLLALVTSALTAPLSLAAGSLIFYVQARLGHVDPRTGFEPNLFLKTYALPLSVAVFFLTFAIALWHLKRSGHRPIRP